MSLRAAGGMHLAGRDHGGDAAVAGSSRPSPSGSAGGSSRRARVDVAVDQAGGDGAAMRVDGGSTGPRAASSAPRPMAGMRPSSIRMASASSTGAARSPESSRPMLRTRVRPAAGPGLFHCHRRVPCRYGGI